MPQFLPVGATHTQTKRREERAGQRAREKVINVRQRAGKAHNKAARGLTNPVPRRSRSLLSCRLA